MHRIRTARSVRIFAVVFAREMQHVHRIQLAQCWREECWSMTPTPSAPRARRGSFGVQPRRRGGKRLGGNAASTLRHFQQPLTRCITLQSSTRGTCSLTLGGSCVQVAKSRSSRGFGGFLTTDSFLKPNPFLIVCAPARSQG